MGTYARWIWVVFTAFAAGCGGDIVFGNDRADGGPLPPVDTGPTTPVDTGVVVPHDAGVPPGMDATTGTPDTGVRPGTDGGGGCPTTFPAQWPFPMTLAAYKSHFWTPVAVNATPLTCTTATICHGTGSTHTPLIPAADADIMTNLSTVITQLMAVSQPNSNPAQPGPLSWIASHHKPGSPDQPNTDTFSATTQAAVEAFINEVQSCAGCVGGDCSACPTAPASCKQ